MLGAWLWLAGGCAVRVAEIAAQVGGGQPPGAAWEVLIDEPGPVRLDTAVSARWAVPLGGLVDLHDPAASELERERYPIVLPVTALVHPERGVWVVDTGIDAEIAAGRRGALRGALIRAFAASLEPVEPLSAIVARQGAPLSGVLLTHAHFDHVLGLPDVPAGTPVYVGAGELRGHGLQMALLRRSLRAAFDGVTLSVLDPARAVDLGELRGWDLLGDGTLWALAAPGHTPGSTAYLARTPDGPVLLTGDTSHTRWGWDHGVAPGTFTEDHEANRASLDALRALAVRHPAMRVLVGHEVP